MKLVLSINFAGRFRGRMERKRDGMGREIENVDTTGGKLNIFSSQRPLVLFEDMLSVKSKFVKNVIADGRGRSITALGL